MTGDVRYALIKREMSSGRARVSVVHHYELVRVEDGIPETLAQGEGLEARLRLVTYLREIADLGGPDAPAAVTALKAGWSPAPIPMAPEPGA